MSDDVEQKQTESREKKRSQFSEPGSSRKSSTAIIIGVFVVAAAIAAYLVVTSGGGGGASPAPTASDESATEYRIPVASLSDGRAKFLTHNSGGTTVRFFVIKSSDGVYRAALDACDVCYHSKKGYEQQGDEMVCKNCGQTFRSSLINEVRGGCNPVGVARAIDGDSVVIKKSELDQFKGYF